jgi:hypothetical protein
MTYEGAAALQSSFGMLGQVASAERFANPQTAAALAGIEAGIEKNVVKQRLKTLAKP